MDELAALARALGLTDDRLYEIPVDPPVPGIRLVRVDRGEPTPSIAAILSDTGQAVLGRDEVCRTVFAAWSWAPGRVRAEQVAAVITHTLDLPGRPEVLLDPERVVHLGRLGAEGIALPHEETIDGASAVTWWVSTDRETTEVIVEVGIDGRPRLSYGRTHV
jgi:hypothetical protein